MTDAASRCLMGDAGIAVCLLSLPFQHEKLFYDREIQEIYANYRNAVRRNFGGAAREDLKSDFNHFYKPSAYFLFGRFDLAVISLIDDFDFSSRTFHPFDPMLARGEKPYFENFLCKVITGPTPCLDPQADIVTRAKETFLADPRKPLFAITVLKVSNGLLLGCGTNFLRAILRMLAKCSQAASAHDLDVIVLQSYSWHEITLLTFATSYSSIVDFVRDVSEKTAEDLSNFIEDSELAPSLLARYLANRPHSSGVRSAHLFTDCETTLGFECSLLADRDHPGWTQISTRDAPIRLFTRWTVKPGHLYDVSSILEQISGQPPALTLGRGDLATTCPFTTPDAATTASCLKDYLTFRSSQVSPHVLQCYTVVAHHGTLPKNRPSRDETHPLFTDAIRQFRFRVEDTGQIQNNLRRLGTPKIVTMRVLNMFTNFNDGLLDRNLYGYFFELLPFMKNVAARIEDAAGKPASEIAVTDWNIELQRAVSNFEIAYRNRFYNSYRLGEVTDFNTDFKGGIQQLVTAFDGAYKAIAMAAGNHHSFAAVCGEPGVFSTSYETRLNYFHVFQPETFLTVAMHEAASNCFTGVPTMMSARRRLLLSQICEGINALTANAAGLWRDLDAAQMLSTPDARAGHPVGTYFLRSIVIDRLALQLSYNGDAQLLWHWYWGFVAQVPIAYDHPLELSERGVTEFFLRLCTVSDISRATEVADRLGPFRESAIGRICESRQEGVLAGLKRIRAVPGFEAWLKLVDVFIMQTIEDVFEDLSITEPLENGAHQGDRIAAIRAFVRKQAFQMQTQLKQGEVVQFHPDGPFGPCRFCQILSYAYLNLLMKQFGRGEDPLLSRDSDGRTKPQEQGSDVLFDPLGGTFTHAPDTRRKYFRYRSALTLSLWDMAVKMKGDMIWQELQRS